LDVGDEIDSSHPRNHFPLIPAADYVLLAGGIGITPIKAMIAQLHQRGASSNDQFLWMSLGEAA